MGKQRREIKQLELQLPKKAFLVGRVGNQYVLHEKISEKEIIRYYIPLKLLDAINAS